MSYLSLEDYQMLNMTKFYKKSEEVTPKYVWNDINVPPAFKNTCTDGQTDISVSQSSTLFVWYVCMFASRFLCVCCSMQHEVDLCYTRQHCLVWVCEACNIKMTLIWKICKKL